MRKLIAFFVKNAVIYKDLTQWLRTGVFACLFLGLIGTGEAVSFVIVAGAEKPGDAGAAIFNFLSFGLLAHLVVVAMYGGTQTRGEIRSRTFQLYAITGLTQDQVVWGKLSSMYVQLLFGIFCLAPYMFFAQLLGGVDFFRILDTLLGLLLLALPLFIFALMRGFKKPAVDVGGIIARMGCMLVLLFIGAPLLFGVMGALFSSPLASGSLSVTKGVLTLNGEMCVAVLVAVPIYFIVNVYLYAFCTSNLVDSVPALASTWIIRMNHQIAQRVAEMDGAQEAAPDGAGQPEAAGGAQ